MTVNSVLAPSQEGETPHRTYVTTNADEIPVDAREMARQLGSAVSTVSRMAAAGVIPSILIGSRESARRYYPSMVKQALLDRAQGRKVLSKVRLKHVVASEVAE